MDLNIIIQLLLAAVEGTLFLMSGGEIIPFLSSIFYSIIFIFIFLLTEKILSSSRIWTQYLSISATSTRPQEELFITNIN